MQFNITAEHGNYEDLDYYDGHVRFNTKFRSVAVEQFNQYLDYLVELGALREDN
jgi:hypothetical protein|tara:strand:+ start:1032 stop:1193 length:162 start_codon:yes stop_codon:yes gene_type:complete